MLRKDTKMLDDILSYRFQDPGKISISVNLLFTAYHMVSKNLLRFDPKHMIRRKIEFACETNLMIIFCNSLSNSLNIFHFLD